MRPREWSSIANESDQRHAAPAAMPTRKRVSAQREGINVRTRWGWGPSAIAKKLRGRSAWPDEHSLSGEGADIKQMAIGINRHRSIPVCAKDMRPNFAVDSDDLRCWMTKIVGAPDAENRAAWSKGADEIPRARAQAPVMRHLDHPESGWREERRDLPLDLAPDVASQDNRHVPPENLEHDGVVVADFLALPVGRPWMPDRNFHLAERDEIT